MSDFLCTNNEAGWSNYFPNYSFQNPFGKRNHSKNGGIEKDACSHVYLFSKPANHLEFALFSTQSIINKNAFRNRSNHSFYFYCGSQLGLLPLAKMILPPVGRYSIGPIEVAFYLLGVRQPVRAGKCRPYLGAPTEAGYRRRLTQSRRARAFPGSAQQVATVPV